MVIRNDRCAEISYHRRAFVNISREYGILRASKDLINDLGMPIFEAVRYPYDGPTFKVRSNWSWELLENGLRELNSIDILRKTIRPGDVLLDIGAWQGPYTLFMSRLIGESGFVYAFEPDPVSRKTLRQNLKANSARNVSILHYCVSDSMGTKDFSARWFGYGLSNIRNPEHSRKRIKVETTTLDTFAKNDR